MSPYIIGLAGSIGLQRRVAPDRAAEARTGLGIRKSPLINAKREGSVRSMPLRYVDPHKKRGPIYRATVRFGRTRAGLFLGHHFSPRVDPWVSRITNGRGFGPVVNAPLITTGAKSGQPRQVFVAYFHDGRDPIVIASNYGGAKHPQWYYNLKAHPDCDFGGER